MLKKVVLNTKYELLWKTKIETKQFRGTKRQRKY